MLDALDQLSARAQRTDWLPARLAPHVRVVVSVLADRPELGYLRRRMGTEQVVTLAPLGREAGQRMLGDLLAAPPARTLTRDQREAVLTAFAAQGMPLYLRLLASEARRWRSFDAPNLGSSAPLPNSTPELLQAILARLEQPERHGRMLVARSLGDLAAARLGLAEDELLDLLASDEDVSKEQHALSPSSPPIEEDLPLPVALWAGLYAELAPLLSERDSEGSARLYTFYHRQFREAVEARYLAGAERAQRHRALAGYFARQSWRLGTNQWNMRKAGELVTQFEGAGDRPAAEQALNALADELERTQSTQAGGPAGIVALVRALQDRLTTGGYWQVGQRLYARQLAALRARHDRAGEMATLIELGGLAGRQGHLEDAEHSFDQALAIARAIGDRSREGLCCNNLGLVASGRGQIAAAAHDYEQALAIAREVGDRIGEEAALNSLGILTRNQGRFEAAAVYFEQVRAIAREQGQRAAEGIALANLGGVADDQGRAKEAAHYYEQALAIAREVGDPSGEGNTLNNLGVLARGQGRVEDAIHYYEQALAIFRAIGAVEEASIAQQNLAALAGQGGQSGQHGWWPFR